MKKKMTDAEIIAVLAETPLATVIEILRSGKFAPAPKKSVDKGETVIGKLTSREKAIFTIKDIAVDEYNALAKKFNALVTDNVKMAKLDRAKILEMKKDVELSDIGSKALDSFFWATVRKRLHTTDSLSIRNGYKIIKSPSIIESLFELGEGISLLSELAELSSGHLCKKCPADKHAACNLPIKQPRD